jgi:hypothetical protein
LRIGKALLGSLACWACWGVLGLLACWPAGLAGCSFLSFPLLAALFFSFPLLAAFCQLFLLHQDSHVSLLSFSFLFFCFALVWFLFVSFQHYLPFLLAHFMLKYLFVP